MKQILIVEDEKKLAELLADYLRQSGFEPRIVSDGARVMEVFHAAQPAAILLDLMLPGKDGMTLCKELRAISSVPILMTTARVEEIDRLLGLELGADDYICKPYSPREVVARVKAVLRRANPVEAELPDHGLVLDEAQLKAWYQGKLIDLTAVEFNLLHALAAEPGRIFSRSQLMDCMYADHRVVSDRTIDSHIKKLRKKLADVVADDNCIQSVYGVGYRFEREPR